MPMGQCWSHEETSCSYMGRALPNLWGQLISGDMFIKHAKYLLNKHLERKGCFVYLDWEGRDEMEAPGLDGAEYPDTQNGFQFSLLPMHEHEKSLSFLQCIFKIPNFEYFQHYLAKYVFTGSFLFIFTGALWPGWWFIKCYNQLIPVPLYLWHVHLYPLTSSILKTFCSWKYRTSPQPHSKTSCMAPEWQMTRRGEAPEPWPGPVTSGSPGGTADTQPVSHLGQAATRPVLCSKHQAGGHSIRTCCIKYRLHVKGFCSVFPFSSWSQCERDPKLRHKAYC